MKVDAISNLAKANRRTLGEKRRIRESRITRILELTQRGYSKFEISKELKIQFYKLDKYYKVINKRIKVDQSRRVEEWIWFVTQKYDYLYRQCIEAFEQSQKDSKGKPKPGNVVFLDAARNVLADFRKLTGIDKQPELVVSSNSVSASLNWDSITQGRMSPLSIQTNVPQLESAIEKPVSAYIDPIEQRIQEVRKLANAMKPKQVNDNKNDGEFIDPLIDNGEGDRISAESVSSLQEVSKPKVVIRKPVEPVKPQYDRRVQLNLLGEE